MVERVGYAGPFFCLFFVACSLKY